MTLDDMLEIAERAWSDHDPCYRCEFLYIEPSLDDMGENVCLAQEYGEFDRCPAVAAVIEQEIDDECERAA
ncbi:MAG: hypothetical protein KGI71_05135 [Patescibacteria group bacterium]|nr:hypothetical protein [Patescibacteria group bacterium]